MKRNTVIIDIVTGVKLVLDPSQIFPADPGQGTPAMVYYAGGSATYWCATGEGMVTKGWEEIELPQAVQDWLSEQNKEVEQMYADAALDRVNGEN